MPKFSTWMPLAFAASLVSGCSPTVGADSGTGHELMTPKAETVSYIAENDRRFANQVASNNRACQRETACVKGPK